MANTMEKQSERETEQKRLIYNWRFLIRILVFGYISVLLSGFRLRSEVWDVVRTNEKNTSRWTHPLQGIVKHNRTDLPEPIQIMERYIQQHSVHALEQNPNHRSFAVAFYQCPFRAGNIFHMFASDLILAILTNRTLLVQYWNPEACETFQKTTKVCKVARNFTEEICSQVLHRAPWLPLYSDWKDKLALEDGDDERFVLFKSVGGLDLNLFATWRRQGLLDSTSTQLEEGLLLLGYFFLYGMVFRYSFDFAGESIKGIPDSEWTDSDVDVFTVGLQSRHVFANDTGCNIQREIDCFHELGLQAKPKVKVRAMSDRKCTLEKLEAWLVERNMTFVQATKDELRHPGRPVEHGPFDQFSYFRDFALVSRSRSAFIGSRRSSSDLVHELNSFYHILDNLSNGNELQELPFCKAKEWTAKLPKELQSISWGKYGDAGKR